MPRHTCAGNKWLEAKSCGSDTDRPSNKTTVSSSDIHSAESIVLVELIQMLWHVWHLVQLTSLDSSAVSVFADIFIELTNTVSVSDNKIQITILILWRGSCLQWHRVHSICYIVQPQYDTAVQLLQCKTNSWCRVARIACGGQTVLLNIKDPPSG